MRHLSDIKKYERCPKLLWNAIHNPQPFYPFITYNESIVELVKQKLNIQKFYEGVRNDDNEVFFFQEAFHDCFFNIRFEYRGLRVKAPMLRREKDGYMLSFLFASCFPKENDAQNIADTIWVLEHLGIAITDVSVFHLVADYERQGELDVSKLICEVSYLYNDRNKPAHSLSSLIARKKRDLDFVLDKMERSLQSGEPQVERSQICTKRNKCTYFDFCFPKDDDTSIFNLVSCGYKFDLFKQGITHIEDLDFSEIEGTKHQFAQYMAARNKKLFFDDAAVINFFSDVAYPISYLDFEWETFAYPPYDKMKPYDVLIFQYSLHIEEENGNLDHKDYLGKGDCRISFIENLLKDIPKEGSIFCFNVEGAEKLRLKQLAVQYPQYAKALEAIWIRMIDLATPFSNGLIYDSRMAGMYSLKKLVEIFTDYSYENLEISHGLEAVRSYIDLEDNENEEVIDDLLKYCAMDTYAMYLIYHWILKQHR